MANLIHCDLGKMHHSHHNVITALPQMHKAETNGHIWTYSIWYALILQFCFFYLCFSLSLCLSPLFTTHIHTRLANLCPAAMGVVLTADYPG